MGGKKKSLNATTEGSQLLYLALHICFPASIWFIEFVTKDCHKWETKAIGPYLHQNNFIMEAWSLTW